ncbi:MAG TPA: glycosyltransferase family 2 protein [Candidatus Paceibacterota bacterium]|nr:glycosyltransferase family 2 protein [Candidatus Paceibacterota bacterium]
MADQTGHKRIVAIVPAYDEERDIAGVLRELSSYRRFNEVIVVDDGSADATAQIAATFPVRLIRHERNLGKGAAMQSGVDATDADILFFCDADMRGFSHDLLDDILAPVVAGETDMVIAMRNARMYWAGYVLSIIPILGGQRAVARTLWDIVPDRYRERFMVETALNFYAKYWGRGFQYKVVSGLRQTIKERKYGLWRGVRARVQMGAEVVLAQVRLQFAEVPRSVRTGRIALANTVGALSGAFLGAIFLVAAYSGPANFVRELYADTLRSDPDTPFVDLLLYLATNIGVDLLAFLGVALVALNVFFALLSAQNLRYLTYARSAVERIP